MAHVPLINGATYRLACRAENKNRSLNVYGTTPQKLANVCLFRSKNSDICQQWVYREENGRRYFVCKGNIGLALDLLTDSSAGSNVNNYNAHVYPPSSTSYLVIEDASDKNYDYIRIRLANYTNKYLTANQGSDGTSGGRDVNAAGNVYWYKGGLTDFSQDWEPILLEKPAQPEPEPTGSQKLRLPVNGENQISASRAPSYSSAYAVEYGQPHYGADIACANGTPLKGLGNGTVVGAGKNDTEGNFVSVRYNSCIPVQNGVAKNVIMRYFHMRGVSVKVGDTVTTSTILGYSGNTGAWAFGKNHLHMELDMDTENPNHTPSIPASREGGGLYSGSDTCANPFDWLYTYSGQFKSRYYDSDETWVFPRDMTEHSPA